jgi:cytoskeletal protein CcmA (bactofilin family)
MWNNKREDEATARPHLPTPMAPPGDPMREHAAIGSSITIIGDVTGDEDITVLGKIEGKITLPKNNVTIGRSAHVTADICAKSVSVEGEVNGNLLAGEQILIRKTAKMHGNLTAPRVGLEDGCRFRGSVDMETQPGEKGRTPAPTTPARPVPETPAATPAKHAGGNATERLLLPAHSHP